MSVITVTQGRLHFSDLDPRRFEDLCLTLVYGMRAWKDIRHYGRVGADRGVDIWAQERAKDGDRLWCIQCRRYARATSKTLIQALDETLAHAAQVPEVLVLVVAADVRREAHEHFEARAKACGVGQPILWTASVLEAELRTRRPDLVQIYFDASGSPDLRAIKDTLDRDRGGYAQFTAQLRRGTHIILALAITLLILTGVTRFMVFAYLGLAVAALWVVTILTAEHRDRVARRNPAVVDRVNDILSAPLPFLPRAQALWSVGAEHPPYRRALVGEVVILGLMILILLGVLTAFAADLL